MAIDTKNKKTSLENDASIYEKRDENKSEKARWAEMSKAEKITHFKTYYLRWVVIGFVVLLIGSYIFYTDVIMKKDMVSRCAIVNEFASEPAVEAMSDGFTRYLGLDPDKNITSFRLYFTNSEMANQVGASASNDLTQISSLIYASSLDFMIAGEEDFKTYMDNGFFTPIDQILTKEEMEKLKDKLFIPEESTQKVAVGIYLDNVPKYKELFKDGGGAVEKPILGIIFNSEKKDIGKEYIKYLFPEVFENK